MEAFTHVMVIVYNLMHSPWGSEALLCAIRESSEEYLAIEVETCPLFKYRLLLACVGERLAIIAGGLVSQCLRAKWPKVFVP